MAPFSSLLKPNFLPLQRHRHISKSDLLIGFTTSTNEGMLLWSNFFHQGLVVKINTFLKALLFRKLFKDQFHKAERTKGESKNTFKTLVVLNLFLMAFFLFRSFSTFSFFFFSSFVGVVWTVERFQRFGSRGVLFFFWERRQRRWNTRYLKSGRKKDRGLRACWRCAIFNGHNLNNFYIGESSLW